VTNSAGASQSIPNYNASDAIGKSALTTHTVYAHIGAMYYEMTLERVQRRNIGIPGGGADSRRV